MGNGPGADNWRGDPGRRLAGTPANYAGTMLQTVRPLQKGIEKTMQKRKTLSQIFQNEPSRWGLRGDPYLWREMKSVLGDQAYPSTEEDFIGLLEQTYEQLAGKSIKEQGSFFVEKYSHGGMSSGQVDPKFWTETGLPLLQARYRETK
jgi:hypothetical protein